MDPELELDITSPVNRAALDIEFGVVLDLVLRRAFDDETTSIFRLSGGLGLSTGVLTEAFDELRGRKYLDVQGLNGHDYIFSLTESGKEQARSRNEQCRYNSIAPVSLKSYLTAVQMQRLSTKVNRAALVNAMSDLVVAPEMLDQLGPAFNSQHSMFFYGPAGTGKTSLAERLVRLYTDWIIVPRAVLVDGRIVVVYDPIVHEAVPTQPEGLDPRWVACRRPLVAVGGELEGSMLQLAYEPVSGVYMAPLQMKANNGMMLIDDFGRQTLTPEQLLNRWIYPLVKRMDFLTLVNGTKFAVPFELMVVFSTNMDPNDLGDEAFFRRIQNKVFVGPTTAEMFDRILVMAATAQRVALNEHSALLLRELCTSRDAIGLRANYPWDMCKMIRSICEYEERQPVMDRETLDRAASLYWGGMAGNSAVASTAVSASPPTPASPALPNAPVSPTLSESLNVLVSPTLSESPNVLVSPDVSFSPNVSVSLDMSTTATASALVSALASVTRLRTSVDSPS